MIEITGLVFGDAALTASITTDTGKNPLDLVTYNIRLAVRDGDGDHLYQRSVTLGKEANILGVLQVVLDELPEDAFTASALWMPGRHNKMRLELPPT